MLLHSLLQTYCEFLNFVYVVFDALSIENHSPPYNESLQFLSAVCIDNSAHIYFGYNLFNKC